MQTTVEQSLIERADWKLVLDYRFGGYAESFDPNRVCEFKRVGADEVHRFRMKDQSPYMNIAGLLWRDVKEG